MRRESTTIKDISGDELEIQWTFKDDVDRFVIHDISFDDKIEINGEDALKLVAFITSKISEHII